VTVEGDEVIVEFPEKTPGSRAEASRLAEKAGNAPARAITARPSTSTSASSNSRPLGCGVR